MAHHDLPSGGAAVSVPSGAALPVAVNAAALVIAQNLNDQELGIWLPLSHSWPIRWPPSRSPELQKRVPAGLAAYHIPASPKLKKEAPALHVLLFWKERTRSRHCLPTSHPTANPAERSAVGSKEKARSAYEKALRPFLRLRAFSGLVREAGLEPARA